MKRRKEKEEGHFASVLIILKTCPCVKNGKTHECKINGNALNKFTCICWNVPPSHLSTVYKGTHRHYVKFNLH